MGKNLVQDYKSKMKRARKGRSLKLKYPEFKQITDAYLSECEREKSLPTLTALSLRLNIDDLTDYGKRPPFAHDIKRVKKLGEVWLTTKLSTTEKPLINHIFLAKAIGGLRDNGDTQSGVAIGKGVVILPKRG